MRRWPGLLFVLVLAWAGPAQAGPSWSAPVTRVVDGDTLQVDRDGQIFIIRLWGVDCPERNQPWGRDATELNARINLGRVVLVHQRARDRYGRLVAEVVTDQGERLSLVLLRAGLAWWTPRYAAGCRECERAEAQAKADRLGLWSQADPIPPWRWRRRSTPSQN